MVSRLKKVIPKMTITNIFFGATILILLLLVWFNYRGYTRILKRAPNEAYVTLVTTQDRKYFVGIMVLLYSIRQYDKTRDLVLLSTTKLSNDLKEILKALGTKYKQITPVQEFNLGSQCKYLSDMDNSNRWERWGHMFSKLKLWEMVEYDKVLYMDADIMALPSIPSLFEKDEMTAEKGVMHDFFNCGYMVLVPGEHKYQDMLNRAATQGPPDLFGNIIDCTEQGFLNAYFPQFTNVPIGRPDVFMSDQDALKLPMIHWVKMQCGKPWEWERCHGDFLNENCYLKPYFLWWKVFQAMDEYLESARISEWKELKTMLGLHSVPWDALKRCQENVNNRKKKNKRKQ